MKANAFHQKHQTLILLLIFGLGCFLRLDQLTVQVLMDDEWHAVHQLLFSTPAKIFTSFGHADYSIPLTLLYWFQAQTFGLSELSMRLPMVLAGLLTLTTFVFYCHKHHDFITTAMFALFIATAPLLIFYAQVARPYAITVFLVYLSYLLFAKAITHSSHKAFYIISYSLCAALAIWLHLVVVFFIVAPFCHAFLKITFQNNNQKTAALKPVLFLAFVSGATTLLLLIAPLINDLSSIQSKASVESPSLDTWMGALQLWFGVGSFEVMIIWLVFAVIGFKRMLRTSHVAISALIGFVLTTLAIYLLQPVWVDNAITLARYLLPILPLLLLSAACGVVAFTDHIQKWWGHSRILTAVIIGGLVVVHLTQVRSIELSANQSNNKLHAVHHLDYRGDNKIEVFMSERPFSPFWGSLKESALDGTMAVAPWYFETFYWDGPVWETLSNQRVVPGYLNGLCTNDRFGETTDDDRFSFKNIAFLNDPIDLQSRGIEWVVFQKQARLNFDIHINSKFEVKHCINQLKALYGPPFFEDNLITVFKTSKPND